MVRAQERPVRRARQVRRVRDTTAIAAYHGGGLLIVRPFDIDAVIVVVADRRVETVTLDPAPSPTLTEVERPIADFYGYPLPGRSFYATAMLRL